MKRNIYNSQAWKRPWEWRLIPEARATCQKLLYILIDGEQWLKESYEFGSNNNGDKARGNSLSKYRNEKDAELRNIKNMTIDQCHKALMGELDDFDADKKDNKNDVCSSGFYIHGTFYLESLISLYKFFKNIMEKQIQ